MIQLSYGQLAQPQFRQAVRKLSQLTLKSPEDFRIKHILKAMTDFNKRMAEAFEKIKSTYGEEKGSKPPSGKSMDFELPFLAVEGKEEECRKAIEALEHEKLEIPGKPLRESHITSLGDFTAAELIALEPITVEDSEVAPLALAEASPPPASLHN